MLVKSVSLVIQTYKDKKLFEKCFRLNPIIGYNLTFSLYVKSLVCTFKSNSMKKFLLQLFEFALHRGKKAWRPDSLLALFDRHNEEYRALIGHGRSLNSYKRYDVVFRHLQSFLKGRKQEGLRLSDVSPELVRDFERYLRIEMGLKNNSVWVYMITLKHIFSLALASGKIPSNPFAGYRNRFEQVDRGYLSEEELMRLINYPLKPGTQRLVRDLFVFAAFTGLSYVDMKKLRWENVRTMFDGKIWIVIRRTKTHTPSNVLLLDIPLQILARHGNREWARVFPIPSNNCCNAYLIMLGQACGIPTRITFHLARHTFATLSLSKGVPIETLSSVMGHTSIRTTQIYAKVVNEKVGEDMSRLADRLRHLPLPG